MRLETGGDNVKMESAVTFLVLVIVFSAFPGSVAATGYLKSQNGSIVLQPQDTQVLPNSDMAVNLGGPVSRWSNLYAVNITGVSAVFAQNGIVDPMITVVNRNSSARSFIMVLNDGLGAGGIVAFGTNNNVLPNETWFWSSGASSRLRLRQDGLKEILFDVGVTRLNLTMYSLTSGVSITPTADNSVNLGSPANRWANVFATSLYPTNIIPSQGLLAIPYNGSVALRLYPANGVNNRTSQIDFWGTFSNYPTDTGTRRVAYIASGYSTGVWGTEYMGFGVGGSDDYGKQPQERIRLSTTALLPSDDNIYNLGTSSSRWKSVNLYQLRLAPSATAPACDNGVIYLNTANQLKVCLGGVWKTVQVA